MSRYEQVRGDLRRRIHEAEEYKASIAVIRDRSLSAQFEHTIGVTEAGCEVFTYSPRGWHKPPYHGVAHAR